MSPDPTTIYRFRKQCGINLGSWFVLERWITDAPFLRAAQPAQSDYDVARGSQAKAILEEHWNTWITKEDWEWIAEKGLNTVRIPIGFYHLCGIDRHVLDGTDFAMLYDVFSGAWSCIANAITTARQHGIGVLLDLHAAPGKQNADAHSGQTGPVRFFEPSNLAATIRALQLLVTHVHSIPNVVGVQLLNEPQNHPFLPFWYTTALDSLRSIAPTLPLYIHDAWNTSQYAALAGSRQDWTVVDHHLYRCFTPSDSSLSGDTHASVLRPSSNFASSLASASAQCRGNLVVAEFSAALSPGSLGSGDAGEHDRQRRVFASAEIDLFESVCAGWFFWTYKTEAGWDAGWCMRDAMRAEIVPSSYGIHRPSSASKIKNDTAQRDTAQGKALADHTSYWSHRPGAYEHWRFTLGFSRGWDDAYLFFLFPESRSVSELGFTGEWAKMRREMHVGEKGGGGNVWEFDHGLEQGIKAARAAVERQVS